ncbi:MAG: alkaline phosphatase [Candidatus Brocadiales bacterium]|nr:alkaline phosphatase [Candidatus Bathyanammoxibius amoris]
MISPRQFISSSRSIYRPLNIPLFRVIVIVTVILLTAPFGVPAVAGESGAKNVVLLIGDGMGWSHLVMARSFVHGPAGELYMDKFEHSGYVSTFSLQSLITDSAAAATALATGHKTRRGVIGQSVHAKEYKTVLEIAGDTGRSTGLVTTAEVTHATPAAFAAHESSRENAREIAEDYLHRSRPDVIMGGGLRVWTTLPLKEARDMGYEVVYTKEELERVDIAKTEKLLGLFAPEHMSFAMDRRLDEPSLIEMSLKALEVLSKDPDGFFVMIEGGRIDHASHKNDSDAVLYETVAFDETVGAVVEWLEANGLSDETLVIVTADHETGGLAIVGPKNFLPGRGDKPKLKWIHRRHTAEDVPIWAQGPGARAVSGRMDNTDVFKLMREALDPSHTAERP